MAAIFYQIFSFPIHQIYKYIIIYKMIQTRSQFRPIHDYFLIFH